MTLMEIDYKVLLAALGILLIGFNQIRYLIKVFKGVFKPHLFTWAVWAFLNIVAFAAQFSENAGPGMWQTGFAALMLSIVTLAALFKGDKNYKKSDWAALGFSVMAIPIWLATDNPLWAVIWVTIIDIVITWPTLRKSWARPHEESVFLFCMGAFTTSLSILALDVFTLTTLLYVVTIVILDIGTAMMIALRRRATPVSAAT